MKKFLYSAAALALAFFAASCQQENLEPAVSANTVTYTVEVPGALATKAIGDDASGVDKVYYEVYRAKEIETGSPVYEGEATVTAGTASFDLEFVKQQDFVVLFWAQNSNLVYTGEGSTGMYDIADLRAVELKNAGAANNVNAQVFAGKDLVENCASKQGGAVKLVRPISQLNIFTTKESLMFGTKSITLSVSTVTVNGLYTTYNVAEGCAVVTPEAEEFTYGFAAVPTTQDTDPYAYVAMNYVGFAPEASTTVEVDFTIKTSEGDVSHNVSSVPVKPNYRTNIVGNLLTEATDYNVTLDAKWDGAYEEVVVSTAQDLQTTINEAPADKTVEISLSGDINLGDLAALLGTKAAGSSNTLTIPGDKSIVLDLNGYSISGVDETQTSFGLITNKGDLTIVNSDEDKTGKIMLKATTDNGWNRYSSVISTQVGSTLTVGAGVEIEHFGGTSMSYGIDVLTNGKGTSAVAVIDGATVKSTYRAIRQFLNGTEANNSLTVMSGSVITSTTGNKSIWMQDPSKNANSGSLVVEAGAKLMTDAYLDVTEGSTQWPVSVSIAASALQGEATVVSENVPAGYKVELVDGVWTVNFYPVARIGETEYATLSAAIAAAQDGDTITLVDNIEQVDGVIITDKKLTIDLNKKTFTVTNGANTNNRNFKINGSSVVTIKNGTMVADGDYSSGAYGTVRTEGTANVTLTDVKLYNYRGNGLNVKALSGTTVTISDTEVYSVYGGGIEAAGGTIELTNVKVEQKGMYTAPYNSMAISVNGGGTVTVNSGTYSTECITAEDANNQGTSHGPWCAGVLNSGGTLIIKGGTFSNDNFGENSLATAARGLLLADTGANIQINGGNFNAVKAIVDVTNNLGDASRNPSVTLAGGDFSADPRVSGLYASELISVDEGFVVKEENGTFKVVEYKPVAKVGTNEYGSIDEAIDHWTNNSTLTLLADVTLSDVVTLKSTEHHILDLGTFTMTAAANKNVIEIVPEGDGAGTAAKSCLTINADATNPGSMNAGSNACVYYKKTNGINDRIMVTINGGIFDGTISSSSNNGGQACPYFVFNGGVFNKSINLTKAMLKVTGGIFHSMFSCTGDSTAHRLISGGTFKSLTFMTADAANKFCVGTEKQTYNVGLYINDDGYLVVGGPVITEFGDKFAAKATNATKWSSYLQYSSAAANGLYYTNSEAAIKKHGAANVVLK